MSLTFGLRMLQALKQTFASELSALAGGSRRTWQKRWRGACRIEPKGCAMTKAIGLLLLLAMGIQLIRPLGFPGFRRRADFWKIAVVAFVLWTLVLLLRP